MKCRLAIIISDKTDFEAKSTTTDKYGHYIMNKGKIPQDDKTFLECISINRTCSKEFKEITRRNWQINQQSRTLQKSFSPAG